MRSLLPRTIALHFSLPPPLRPPLLLSHSAAGDDPPRRRSDLHQASSSHRRQHEEESRQVRVAVWWDFENCNVPGGVNVCRVAQRITSALRSSGIKGPVTITAFGDVAQLSRATQEALTSTGVCLTHVPHSGKNSSDRFFMADLVYWVSQNPPPMHFFLISGDRDFANILHRLRMSNYNVLLASNDSASGVLCSAATIMWPWNGLVRGENVSVKHFNYPPDGTYGSWYGYYKGVLDDPFIGVEQPATLQPEESMEQIAEDKPRAIPKALMNAIRHILHSYPEGINLSELRAELKRNNVIMDKDFFGHKKFSHLLSAMPNIVQFVPHPSGEGQPLVVSGQRKVVESAESSSKSSAEGEDMEMHKAQTSPMNTKSSHVSSPSTAVESSGPPQGQDVVVGQGLFKRIWRTLADPHPTSTPESLLNLKGSAGSQDTLSPEETQVPTAGGASTPRRDVVAEKGFFRKIWRTLAGPKGGDSSEKHAVSDVDLMTSKSSSKTGVSLKNGNQQEKASQSKRNVPSHLGSPSTSSDATKSHPGNKSVRQSDNNVDALDEKTGFFTQMLSWLKFWKSSSNYEGDDSLPDSEVLLSQQHGAHGHHSKSSAQVHSHPESHDLFSKSDFWDSLESFLLTAKGSDIILKSRTREQLVRLLQKEGPWILKGLKESHIFQLMNLLIVDKKWVEEYPQQMFPFKIKILARQRCVASHAPGSNGLSSLFTGRVSQSNLQRLSEQEKRDQASDHLGITFNGRMDDKVPKNLAELKAWFQRTYNGTENIDPEDFQNVFEIKFDQKLVCSTYGYSTVRSLIEACLTETGYNQGKKRKPPTREEILSDCHKLLVELLEENPDGFNMSIFRPAFIQRYGYVLDYQILGYPKLVSLLQIMPEVKVESSFILPAGKFNTSSSCKKVMIDESIAPSERDEKGKDDGPCTAGPSNGEDSIWDELGPVFRSDVSDDQISNERVGYNEVSLSDEELTDSEGEAPIQINGSDGQSKRCQEESSLLQILDSWYSSKEGGEKDQTQAVDGLVDCSKVSAEKPSDLKHAGTLKPKMKPHRSYSFVSQPKDEKEKLVESILGSLRKAGDSRLHG